MKKAVRKTKAEKPQISDAQLIKKVMQLDAALVKAQDEIAHALREDRELGDLKCEWCQDMINSIDLIDFLRADTFEKRINLVLLHMVKTVPVVEIVEAAKV